MTKKREVNLFGQNGETHAFSSGTETVWESKPEELKEGGLDL